MSVICQTSNTIAPGVKILAHGIPAKYFGIDILAIIPWFFFFHSACAKILVHTAG